jgi:cholesterol transport system auxiliary component
VKYLLMMISSLALTACGGSLFQSNAPAPAVYLLSVSAAPTGAEIPVDLAVLKPRVQTGLDTDLIAALYPDRRLDYFAGARWSGRLDEMLQDLLLQAFRTRANLRNVHAGVSAFGGGYWLQIDVADFQAEYSANLGAGDMAAPTIHVRLWGRLGGSDRRVLGRFEAQVRQPATDNRLAAIVAAYNAAADAALSKIVEDTAAALNGSLERR